MVRNPELAVLGDEIGPSKGYELWVASHGPRLEGKAVAQEAPQLPDGGLPPAVVLWTPEKMPDHDIVSVDPKLLIGQTGLL